MNKDCPNCGGRDYIYKKVIKNEKKHEKEGEDSKWKYLIVCFIFLVLV